jgi:hypothetical protein
MKNAANNFTLSIYDHLAIKHTLIDLWTFLSVAHITCVTALHKKKMKQRMIDFRTNP